MIEYEAADGYESDRLKYGVSLPDTFGFDSYLTVVFANGLRILADNLHGYPVDYANGEQWQTELNGIASKFEWLNNLDDMENSVFEYFMGGYVDSDLDEDFLRCEKEENEADWIQAIRALHERKEQIVAEVFEWMKINFSALWD